MDSAGERLVLAAPDWGELDTVRQHELPFVLWPVGDQPLLAHWFDEAFNRGFQRIEILAADRPGEVRRFCEGATLWPIEKEVRPVKSVSADAAQELDRLPWQEAPSKRPSDGWSLLHFWQELELSWFDHYKEQLANPETFLSIGRHCQIHRTVELIPPYWIGDEVSIGPGCRIGPFAAVGHGCLLAGESRIGHARLERNTYLAPETELRDAWLDGRILINFRHASVVRKLDTVIAGSVSAEAVPRVGLWQRMRAWQLRGKLREPAREAEIHGKTLDVETLDGRNLRIIEHEDPRVARWHCYAEVIRGRMPLIGIPPYAKADLVNIPPEWKTVLHQYPVGMFGLSDAHATPHTPLEERLVHDIYQAESLSLIEVKTLLNAFLRTPR